MRLGLGAEEPAQEHGKGSLCQERNVPACHLEGENATNGSGQAFAARHGSESTRVPFEHAQLSVIKTNGTVERVS